MAIYVPIIMYGLRLFIVVLQELHCLPNCLHVFMIRVIGCYRVTKFRYSTLGIHIPFSEHTTIITVNIVVNNVVLVKQQ